MVQLVRKNKDLHDPQGLPDVEITSFDGEMVLFCNCEKLCDSQTTIQLCYDIMLSIVIGLL